VRKIRATPAAGRTLRTVRYAGRAAPRPDMPLCYKVPMDAAARHSDRIDGNRAGGGGAPWP